MTTLDDPSGFTPRPVGFDWPLWRGRWAAALMLVCAALCGPIGYAGQLGYAALIGILGIASLPMLGVKRPPMIGVGILLALALWCLIAVGWSVAAPAEPMFHRYKQVEGLTALKLVLELAFYGAFAFLMRELPGAWANRIMLVLTAGLLLIAVVMSIDALTGSAIYRGLRLSAHAADQAPGYLKRNAARGCYTLALLFWPVALWMRRANWTIPLIGMVVAFLVAAVGLGVDAPIAAVVLGGAALFAVRRLGRPAVWVLLAGTVLYFGLAPTVIDLLGPHLPAMHDGDGIAKESWGARVGIWRFTSGLIAERPWLGWGMDASRMWPKAIPLHPHNAALQVWLELGTVGAALAALFWAWLWSRIGALADTSRSDAGVGAAVAVAYLVIGALSFGVWQEWWLALGVLAAVVCQVFALTFVGWTDDRASLQELQPLG